MSEEIMQSEDDIDYERPGCLPDVLDIAERCHLVILNISPWRIMLNAWLKYTRSFDEIDGPYSRIPYSRLNRMEKNERLSFVRGLILGYVKYEISNYTSILNVLKAYGNEGQIREILDRRILERLNEMHNAEIGKEELFENYFPKALIDALIKPVDISVIINRVFK